MRKEWRRNQDNQRKLRSPIRGLALPHADPEEFMTKFREEPTWIASGTGRPLRLIGLETGDGRVRRSGVKVMRSVRMNPISHEKLVKNVTAAGRRNNRVLNAGAIDVVNRRGGNNYERKTKNRNNGKPEKGKGIPIWVKATGTGAAVLAVGCTAAVADYAPIPTGTPTLADIRAALQQAADSTPFFTETPEATPTSTATATREPVFKVRPTRIPIGGGGQEVSTDVTKQFDNAEKILGADPDLMSSSGEILGEMNTEDGPVFLARYRGSEKTSETSSATQDKYVLILPNGAVTYLSAKYPDLIWTIDKIQGKIIQTDLKTKILWGETDLDGRYKEYASGTVNNNKGLFVYMDAEGKTVDNDVSFPNYARLRVVEVVKKNGDIVSVKVEMGIDKAGNPIYRFVSPADIAAGKIDLNEPAIQAAKEAPATPTTAPTKAPATATATSVATAPARQAGPPFNLEMPGGLQAIDLNSITSSSSNDLFKRIWPTDTYKAHYGVAYIQPGDVSDWSKGVQRQYPKEDKDFIVFEVVSGNWSPHVEKDSTNGMSYLVVDVIFKEGPMKLMVNKVPTNNKAIYGAFSRNGSFGGITSSNVRLDETSFDSIFSPGKRVAMEMNKTSPRYSIAKQKFNSGDLKPSYIDFSGSGGIWVASSY